MRVGDLIKVRYNEPTGFKVAIVTKMLHNLYNVVGYPKYAVEILPVDEKTPFRVFPSEIIEVINENR